MTKKKPGLCSATWKHLGTLNIGEGCPDCGHSPLVHTDGGCSVCLALDAARRAEKAATR